MAKRISPFVGSLVFLAGFALVAWFILPARLTNAIWYSAKYWVYIDQVHCTSKPADCGECRKVVTAYNVDGQLVGGDAAPRCKHDLRVGRDLITYDGKTWTAIPLGQSCPDPRVSNVQISWTKAQ